MPPPHPALITLLLTCMTTLSASAAVISSLRDTFRDPGLVLLDDLNCTACHAASANQSVWLSPKMAPRLAQLGDRASPDWVRQYLAAPNVAMPGTTMPEVLPSAFWIPTQVPAARGPANICATE